MTKFEEKLRDKFDVFIFSCGECGAEVLIPDYSKLRLHSVLCGCKKTMMLADSFTVSNGKIDTKKQ